MRTAIVERLLRLPRATTPDVAVTRDLRVPLPDGAVLVADRYAPRNSGPAPVILFRTPYGKHSTEARTFAAALARRGLPVVVQNARGTFGSGGDFRPFHHEQADGTATVRWLRAQPWCDGRIALAGASYLGYTAWATATALDPPPVAVAVGATAADITRLLYPGGALALADLVAWSAIIRYQHDGVRGQLRNLVRRQRISRAMWTVPLSGLDVAAFGGPDTYLRDVVSQAVPGHPGWSETVHSGRLGDLDAAVSMVAGWQDLFLPSQLRDFTTLRAAGRTARITIGPWGHGVPILVPTLRDHVDFLRAELLGVPTDPRPRVRLLLQESGRWLDFDEWPPPAATPTPLYLHDSRALAWRRPGDGAPAEFTYDPADPTPSVGGPLLVGRRRGAQREVERRADVLVYTGHPLARDLDLVGDVTARVHVRLSGPANLFVRLCDVDRNGVSRNVTDGIVALHPHASDTPHPVDVPLNPTAYRFHNGHRLRVQLAAGAFPRYARNPGTGAPLPTATTLHPVHLAIHHTPETPSHLLLPVLHGR